MPGRREQGAASASEVACGKKKKAPGCGGRERKSEIAQGLVDEYSVKLCHLYHHHGLVSRGLQRKLPGQKKNLEVGWWGWRHAPGYGAACVPGAVKRRIPLHLDNDPADTDIW